LVNSEKPHDAAMRNMGTGFVVLSHHSFVSFFVSLLARLRENGWTDLHENFMEGAE